MNSITYGGSYKDADQPLQFYFPNTSQKRNVRVTLIKYYGIGKHYFVSIKEENNPMWSETKGGWFLPWGWDGWDFSNGDVPWHGYSDSAVYGDPASARTWIQEQLKKFSTTTHEVFISDYLTKADGNNKWFYDEGD